MALSPRPIVFELNSDFSQKSQNFPTSVYLTPPGEVVPPWNFVYNGGSRWWKELDDVFIRVTDRRTDVRVCRNNIELCMHCIRMLTRHKNELTGDVLAWLTQDLVGTDLHPVTS